MDLFGNGATANHRTLLEHKRLQATLREITRGHQTIVTRPNDYNVVSH
jgi:hypothetical protein